MKVAYPISPKDYIIYLTSDEELFWSDTLIQMADDYDCQPYSVFEFIQDIANKYILLSINRDSKFEDFLLEFNLVKNIPAKNSQGYRYYEISPANLYEKWYLAINDNGDCSFYEYKRDKKDNHVIREEKIQYKVEEGLGLEDAFLFWKTNLYHSDKTQPFNPAQKMFRQKLRNNDTKHKIKESLNNTKIIKQNSQTIKRKF